MNLNMNLDDTALELRRLLNRLLCMVNGVTAFYRHHNTIPDARLRALAESQIDIERALDGVMSRQPSIDEMLRYLIAEYSQVVIIATSRGVTVQYEIGDDDFVPPTEEHGGANLREALLNCFPKGLRPETEDETEQRLVEKAMLGAGCHDEVGPCLVDDPGPGTTECHDSSCPHHNDFGTKEGDPSNGPFADNCPTICPTGHPKK